MVNDKSEQIRLTFEDVIKNQNKMRDIVKAKIKNNDILHEEECKNWMHVCAYALMTWGKTIHSYLDLPMVRIHMGCVHTFALSFMDWKDKHVVISVRGDDYDFEIKVLWELLYKYMMHIFPKALDEALHISREAEKREAASSFGFSANRNLEGV